MSALAVAPSTRPACRHRRLSGHLAVRRGPSGRLPVLAGAVLVASRAASCASNSSQGTTNQQATSTAATTVAATTATPTTDGQVVRGTGYSVSVPTSWNDMTSVAKSHAHGPRLDLEVVGPETQGVVSTVVVVIQPTLGFSLARFVDDARKGSQEGLPNARLVGRVERLRVGGAPAMAYEFTFSQDGHRAHGRVVACLRRGRFYIVNFSAYQQAFPTDRAALQQILASWTWG